MNIEEVRNGAPEGATHYLRFYNETWYIKWSSLIAQYVTFHDGIWVTFTTPLYDEIKPL